MRPLVYSFLYRTLLKHTRIQSEKCKIKSIPSFTRHLTSRQKSLRTQLAEQYILVYAFLCKSLSYVSKATCCTHANPLIYYIVTLHRLSTFPPYTLIHFLPPRISYNIPRTRIILRWFFFYFHQNMQRGTFPCLYTLNNMVVVLVNFCPHRTLNGLLTTLAKLLYLEVIIIITYSHSVVDYIKLLYKRGEFSSKNIYSTNSLSVIKHILSKYMRSTIEQTH